ncbi:hypothetical protein [Nonomuraea jabiensis]|uniref:Uncharacterized protein n=1 Tax=Nonomuraea jabiensis TaxID=882448 RepID=A0A7W9G1Q8_9ACTN|nr:hypothetical protein [Nonomuraea jabiensis]MBB5775583.1 hypothetical protein [Nonomuraea jabiensis]
MGVTLPPAAAGMMAMLGPWPNLDEDDVRAEGNASRVAQAASVPAASGADASMRGVQQVYRGEGGASAQAHWARTGGDGGGHLAQAGNAMKLAPAVLDAGASVVSAVKVAAGTQAISTTVAVYKALAFGGAFGVTYATARTLMARRAVGKILHEGGEGTGKVIAPIIRRRITEPMRRVLDNLRRPGGPGGTPALAGAGGRNVPMRPATAGRDHLDNPNIATFGKKKNNNNNNNNNGNGNGNGDQGQGQSGGRRGKGKRGEDNGLNQQNRKPHDSNARKSSKDRHEGAANHGGRRRIPLNPNKRRRNNG